MSYHNDNTSYRVPLLLRMIPLCDVFVMMMMTVRSTRVEDCYSSGSNNKNTVGMVPTIIEKNDRLL